MNRSESKYFATAARMDEAFLALLEKKDFAYITVKEICTVAGVNRSTFYLHYETVGDLLHESVEYMLRQFLDYMAHDTETFVAKLHTCPLQELYLLTPEYLTPYLNYIREHRRLFRTATENAAVLGLDRAYDQMCRHVLTPILERYGVPQEERAYRMAFFCAGTDGHHHGMASPGLCRLRGTYHFHHAGMHPAAAGEIVKTSIPQLYTGERRIPRKNQANMRYSKRREMKRQRK